jgi:hypothetical protein
MHPSNWVHDFLMRKSSTIITIIFAALFLIGLVALSRFSGQQKDAEAAPALVAEHNAFDFGSISMTAGKVSHRFKIKNPTESEITLTKLYTSCMCTSATLLRNGRTIGPFGMPGHAPLPNLQEQFAPLEEAEVEVIFDPQAHGPAGIGKVTRTIYIEHGGPSLLLTFSAAVTP